jgi:hypothetical protein
LTLSYGLRFESQDRISDHADFAPRLGLAWAVGGGRKGPSKTVLRVGYGWFYTRFREEYVLQVERQNGVNQQEFIVNSPDFYPNVPPVSTLDTQVPPTIYRISPSLHAPETMQVGIGVDRQLASSATLSLNYIHSRGRYQLLSRNINAPLPGTYDPADPTSGVRPLGNQQSIYEYDSLGIYQQNQLIANLRLRAGARLSLFGYYVLNYADADTAGASSFPSNQYDIRDDYGRASYDVRHRLLLGGLFSLPYGFHVSPFVTAASGAPFNIVVGTDLNGDGQFNDRPAFATDLGRPSVVSTRWGIFDTSPIPGQRIIPINFGAGPSQFVANLRVGKSISFGPEVAGATGLARARRSANGRYSLRFESSAQNIFNRRNLAQPVGTLGSPLFGKSNALAGSSSANRILNLQMQFRF